MKMLHRAGNIEISVLLKPNILYCNWLGRQTTADILDTGTTILNIQREHTFRKILNDNTLVVGTWHLAAEWTVHEWFPAMIEAGLWYFAWVLPANVFAELSARRALTAGDVVTTFYHYHDAYTWLVARG